MFCGKKGAVECLRAGIKTEFLGETQEPLGSDILCSSVIAFGTSDMMLVRTKNWSIAGKVNASHITWCKTLEWISFL